MGSDVKILHLCLSCFYIDDAGYQENYLVRQHVDDGHDVLVIASTETFDGKGGLQYIEPQSYMGSDRAKVIRLPYAIWLPLSIARKLRVFTGIYKLIEGFRPDAILFHGCAGNEIATVANYASKHPNVLFYVDSHEDFNNSARSFLSHRILHGLFYRIRLQQALPHIRKILCVNVDAMDFVSEVYRVPADRLEFYPLGGFPLDDGEISRRRVKTRAALGLREQAFVFLQSGKMTPRKKLSSSLRAFSQLPGENLRFLIAGLLTDSIRDEVEALISADPRITFLGWQSTEQLTDLLCAADAYIQPGTQSATMQHALCCGCPAIIDDAPGHQPYRQAGVTLVSDDTSLRAAFAAAAQHDQNQKRSQALTFAREKLDYQKLAQRVVHT